MNIKEIKGSWELGYSLDRHIKSSVYLGENEYGRKMFDTQRTEIGEAIYQLKYKRDLTQVNYLAQEFPHFLRALFPRRSLHMNQHLFIFI